ncbi:signal peptide, CUB and EGF-like domain-containing protein 2 [Eurytemora carolleeae]|uniref:signal peptide, CUB and EGF-like domain-containing protein 2 n=1 Tax=Eurytemora carolleeae TaxID=1294199 RepID=UPI000C766B21|nr:signal peptide, CUB and EGF-like domain-containing protein 2 [Eurytemora carolleeae]|eukprot:XP_023327715.1 signal peptide, CUB and EGF-like domain-containing protein 2 [Eurytemora affinis]
MRKCLLCPRDTYQNQWGQTACWPCPNRTHTDSTGCTSPQQCKLIECGKHSRPDLAVLQTPNYPNLFPMTSSCHWRVRPAEFQTSLIIIPSISLPQLCTHTLNIRSQVDKGSGLIYETCKSSDKPLLLTAQSSSIYVDFQGKGNLTSQGFQISILSVSSEVSQVLEAVLSPDWERTRTVLGYSQKEDRLVARLLSLLSPGLRRQDRTRKHQEKPLIEVVEDTGHSVYLQDKLHKNQDVEEHNQNHFQISQDKV